MRKIDPEIDTVLDTEKASFIVDREKTEIFFSVTITTYKALMVQDGRYFEYYSNKDGSEEIHPLSKEDAKELAVEWGITEDKYEEFFDVKL